MGSYKRQECLNKKIGQFVKLIQKNPDYDHDTAWKILKKLANLKNETGIAPEKKINIFTYTLYLIRSTNVIRLVSAFWPIRKRWKNQISKDRKRIIEMIS